MCRSPVNRCAINNKNLSRIVNEVTARRAQLEQAISRVCSVFLELKIVLKATSKEKVQQSADAFRE